VLGHALYMKAIHGGKAKTDKIDARKIAGMLRGGMFPIAYVYPPGMRATRDLLRRRNHLMRKRAELLAHIQNTVSQYNLPELAVNLSAERNRKGVAELFVDPEVRKIVEVDLAMIDAYDDVLKCLEWDIEKTARRHDWHALLLLRSIHGVGQILALVMLYEIHDINRFETVQQFASYCRLVKCSHESAGKKKGTGGAKIGNAHLKWAIRTAAIISLRESEQAKKFVDRLSRTYNKGKALGIYTHKLGRSIFFMLKNKKVFDMKQFFSQ